MKSIVSPTHHLYLLEDIPTDPYHIQVYTKTDCGFFAPAHLENSFDMRYLQAEGFVDEIKGWWKPDDFVTKLTWGR